MHQNPVLASDGTPIPDSLSGATKQSQNRLVAIRERRVDHLLNRGWLKIFRKRSWNPATKTVALSRALRQVPSHHAMTELHCERTAGSRVGAAAPRPLAIFGGAANAVVEIRREHAETVIDRARPSGSLCGSRGNRAQLSTSRKVGYVAADNLAPDKLTGNGNARARP